MIKIDNRNIFFENLRTGINLFLGAGFSVLEDSKGERLPTATELGSELCKAFDITAAYSNDLEKLSSVLKRNAKKEYQDYLRKRYTVFEYNELYDVLNKICISNIITTNIDNLIPTIMDHSQRYYLNTISFYGATKKDGLSIQYIPLHGDILDNHSELYFGKFELCNVPNKGLFSMMHSALLKGPTLFWGYGFHDGSVSRVLDQIPEDRIQDIWIQLLPNNNDISFFRDLGCNVIIADTEELLNEINNELSKTDFPKTQGSFDKGFWDKYSIPTINQIESMPIKDFYEQGKTHWYYVLTKQAYVTNQVNTIIDSALSEKNLIVVGIPFGGKTTMLMQVACRINKPTYYVTDLNDAKAKQICNNVQGCSEYIILIDNCAEDMKAYRRLAECKNIRTIATSDDFMYESSKHILETVSYKKIDIPDLDINEAKRIFANIPADIRKNKFSYRKKDNEKYSILELIAKNVKHIITQKRIQESLERIKKQDAEAFELILLTAYLVNHKSALTTDVLVAYYGISDISIIRKKLRIAQTYLSEIDISLEADVYDQDYYSLRSDLFAKYTHELGCNSFRKEYASIIDKFVREVMPCYIYKNHVFKRGAYDAELFFNVFGNNADSVYQNLYKNDLTAYTLQQWALYKALTGRFQEAFSDIDKAMHLQPNNFSIKNARAIILFEANKDRNTIDSRSALEEAMNILEGCYLSDKRKVYHAQKYAEFALEFLDKYDKRYIEKAYCWLKELINNEESMSRKTRNLFEKIKAVR